MKPSLLLTVLSASTLLACGGGDSSTAEDAIAGGDISALCTKVVGMMSDADMPECTEQMNEVKAGNEPLFLEIAKCTSEATDKAALKKCNDKDNPRYEALM